MKHLVLRFYDDIWNRQDFAVAEEILAPDFRFRGSVAFFRFADARIVWFWVVGDIDGLKRQLGAAMATPF